MKKVIRFIRSKEISDFLFFSAYGLFLLFNVFRSSFFYEYFQGAPFKALKLLWILILILRELIMKDDNWYSVVKSLFHNWKKLILWILLVGLLLVNRKFTGDSTVLFIALFLVCARNIKFKRIAEFTLWVLSFSVVIVILSAEAGWIGNYVETWSGRNRNYLGFRYALYAPTYLSNITALFLYLKKTKVKWIELVTLLILNVWVFFQTDSRLCFYLSLLMLLVFCVFKLWPNCLKKKKRMFSVLIFSFVICMGLSIVVVAVYKSSGSSALNSLNSALEGRLAYAKSAIVQNGISVFGQPLRLVGNGLDEFGKITQGVYNYVDCLYIQMLVRNGIIFSAVWIAFFTFVLYRCYRVGDYCMMVCLTFFAIRLLVDDLSFQLYYNTFWFAVVLALVDYKKRSDSAANACIDPHESGEMLISEQTSYERID